ncbi:MAG: NUDIX hydrolase [Vicinamibacterales bacterium]|nr:NUDIX hydrolase [Vicinamibacterales bacterium]
MPVLLNRREVHQGRVFRVEVDRVTLPSGHTLDMEIVRHPGSVVLIPVPAPGQVVLIRQYRYVIDRWIWELPAGTLKPGEHPDEAAARECEEEIGLAPGRVERVGGYYPTPGFCDEEMAYYRCLDLGPPAPDSTARPDEDEVIEPRTFAIAEARAMVASGEIVDLKTAFGLTLVP